MTKKPTSVVVDAYTQKIIDNIKVINAGDILEGAILAMTNTAIYVDLAPNRTGIIYGIEYINARNLIKKMNIGDTISVKVINEEDKNGYIDLSLKEAKLALLWNEAENLIKEKKVLSLIVKEANKGGLIIEWNGINGFLPSSQLKGENYPKVENGSKEEILTVLKRLIGKRINVIAIAVIPKESKLIFSETTDSVIQEETKGEVIKKGKINLKQEQKNIVNIVSKYNIGDKIDGVVTGIVDFGIFVKIDNEIEGLVHKSEIDWGLVENTKNHAKIGDKIKTEIIEIKDGKISLSIKKTKENPWKSTQNKYKKDDIVKGVVIKFNKHGALVSIEEGVAGLIHISDFKDEADMKSHLSLGGIYDFIITLFEPKDEKMTLSFKK